MEMISILLLLTSLFSPILGGCDCGDVSTKVIDTDLISVQLPDNVTYTLIVVLVSYLFKMIFDVVYRLRKMECRWGSLCFCRSKFKGDDDDEYREDSPTVCPACSPNVHVNITNTEVDDRRYRLRNIAEDV